MKIYENCVKVNRETSMKQLKHESIAIPLETTEESMISERMIFLCPLILILNLNQNFTRLLKNFQSMSLL